MTKLTDTQLLILSKAAQRDDHAVEPPSELKGAAAQKVVRKLIKDGLLAEAADGPDLPVWRREEDGRPVSLVITAAGLDAMRSCSANSYGTVADSGKSFSNTRGAHCCGLRSVLPPYTEQFSREELKVWRENATCAPEKRARIAAE